MPIGWVFGSNPLRQAPNVIASVNNLPDYRLGRFRAHEKLNLRFSRDPLLFQTLQFPNDPPLFYSGTEKSVEFSVTLKGNDVYM
jgi:hypothetical protein